MPFGLVTKRQLEQHRDEMAREIAAAKRDIEELKYEWAGWFDKYRSLYARLMKRSKDAQPEQPTEEEQQPPINDHSGPAIPFRSRRQF